MFPESNGAVSTGNFYGKVYRRNPEVKINKLSDRVLDHYLGNSHSKPKDEVILKLTKSKRKSVPEICLGSKATRHNVKPLSAALRKRRSVLQNKKMKEKDVIELKDSSEDDSSEEIDTGGKNRRKKSATNQVRKISDVFKSESSDACEDETSKPVRRGLRDRSRPADASIEEDACEDETSKPVRRSLRERSRPAAASIEEDISVPRRRNARSDAAADSTVLEIRKNPVRKAATQGLERMKDVEKELDELLTRRFSSDSVSSGSIDSVMFESSDSDSDLDWKKQKPVKSQAKKVNYIPKPEFSDYEKAVQEKVALRQAFLMSLNINKLED